MDISIFQDDTLVDDGDLNCCIDDDSENVDKEEHTIDDEDAIRRRKTKTKIRLIAKNVGKIAFIVGTAYFIWKCVSNNKANVELDDNINDFNYVPKCKTCGSDMTEFDGWAWHTCTKCGNSVRIIDGKSKWYDEIFKEGKKDIFSDFQLADICRGGELIE